MGGKRTELGWETDVEEANRSLDLALAYMEADDEEDATKKQRLLKRAARKRASPKGTAPGLRTREPARASTGRPHQDSGLGSLRGRRQTKAKESARKEKGKGKGAQKGKKGNPEWEPGKTTQKPDRTSWS